MGIKVAAGCGSNQNCLNNSTNQQPKWRWRTLVPIKYLDPFNIFSRPQFIIAVVLVALAASAQAGAGAAVYSPLAYSYGAVPYNARPLGSFADDRQFVATRVVSPLAYSAPLGYPYAAGAYYGNSLAYAAPRPISYAAAGPFSYANGACINC